ITTSSPLSKRTRRTSPTQPPLKAVMRRGVRPRVSCKRLAKASMACGSRCLAAFHDFGVLTRAGLLDHVEYMGEPFRTAIIRIGYVAAPHGRMIVEEQFHRGL